MCMSLESYCVVHNYTLLFSSYNKRSSSCFCPEPGAKHATCFIACVTALRETDLHSEGKPNNAVTCEQMLSLRYAMNAQRTPEVDT